VTYPKPFSTYMALQVARRYVERNMNTLVRVSHMTAPTPHVDGSSTATSDNVVYEGRGHLAVLSGPMTVGLGDVPQFFATTVLSIPVVTSLGTVDPMINDMVEVLRQEDRMVVDRVFRVMHVETAGLLPVVHRLQLTGWEQVNLNQDSTIPPEWLV